MLTKRLPLIALAVALALIFVVGLARLFTLRYEAGEIYPPYSTLRADPLGAKVIFTALDDLPGVDASRNFLALKKLRHDGPITLVYLGISDRSFWTENEAAELETLVFGGSHIVFAFYPVDRAPESAEARRDALLEREKKRQAVEKESGKQDDKTSPKNSPEKKPRDDGLTPFDALAKRYGFKFGVLPPPPSKAYERHAFLFEPGASLERDIAWHSALFFDQLSPDWHSIYLSENKPVIAERAYGRGSIMLVGDTFPFSNEALRDARRTALLARIFDGPPTVIFDEEHLGITDQPGIVQLALKYRLHGVIAALLLIVALYIWKNGATFVPPAGARHSDEIVVSRRDATQGFEQLLTRAIRPRDLLVACAEEWRRAFPHQPAAALDDELAAQAKIPARQRDPVAAYRAIARAFSRHKTA